MADVRFGSKADIGQCQADVRFTPKSRHKSWTKLRPAHQLAASPRFVSRLAGRLYSTKEPSERYALTRTIAVRVSPLRLTSRVTRAAHSRALCCLMAARSFTLRSRGAGIAGQLQKLSFARIRRFSACWTNYSVETARCGHASRAHHPASRYAFRRICLGVPRASGQLTVSVGS